MVLAASIKILVLIVLLGPTIAGSNFTSLFPCTSESSYQMTPTTIAFRQGTFGYDPGCLMISTGTTVTFSGSFTTHPLEPNLRSGSGGDSPNPIIETTSGAIVSFTFTQVGFYPFHCGVHTDMNGVIWVTSSNTTLTAATSSSTGSSTLTNVTVPGLAPAFRQNGLMMMIVSVIPLLFSN
ncbi:unnamed protein product [Didymodactylos carnosus]|uniref:Blue (type 1) copper domain-containing protein n=1 Tax=Didymodactylos carnosus TaxID=1234261 RepID=A0A814LDY1_9BILA|nr:unnamed protein product [Didymodactylos carnosus]CAF1529122.1 unnamed protein product [Didymodactylos carnosus]CAF3831071.1 unnamed protein product [Didymodactylos carnosus]CAF4315910.1 unnamed protein product [Didymodactylos carnosus]